jgi:D-sedoheptulose 7-phosphate isomerase
MSDISTVRAALAEATAGLERLYGDEATLATIVRAGHLLADTFAAGGRVYSCGNGGSMCDAMHFAEELTGRFREDRSGYAALAISDQVFARFVEAHGRAGDVLLAISTSGTSKNVLVAAAMAQRIGVRVIGLTGRAGTPLAELADIAIVTPAGRYADRVQELHIKVIHILIELVERRLAPENYKAIDAASR